MSPHKFIPVAEAVARLSKDPSTKVGALVVDGDGTILATGYNGFPRGVNDAPARYNDKSVKYHLVCHAEANAVAQAARVGARLMGATLIVTALHPCASCAKQIIQAGIKKVLVPTPTTPPAPIWVEEAEWAATLFDEAGVTVEYYKEQS